MERVVYLFLFFLIASVSCKKTPNEYLLKDPVIEPDSTGNEEQLVFDLPADSAPHFVNVIYIDIDKITRISRFRSGIGHDYSDDFESCRNMKHYFDPGNFANDTISIYAPVKGKITRLFSEWAGSQVKIQSEDYPAFTFVIFHVNTLPGLTENDSVEAGMLIGHHIGSMTMSDIAVRVNTSGNGPKPDSIMQPGMRYFSYFHVISDSLFSIFNSKGINSRNENIITENERNNSPLSCNGESFQDEGTLANWVYLH